MKKILLFSLFILASLPLFSKEKSLKVIKTEWGFEISNVNSKGKRICDGILNLPNFWSNNACIIFISGDEQFNFEEFARKYLEKQSEFYMIKNKNLFPITLLNIPEYALIK